MYVLCKRWLGLIGGEEGCSLSPTDLPRPHIYEGLRHSNSQSIGGYTILSWFPWLIRVRMQYQNQVATNVRECSIKQKQLGDQCARMHESDSHRMHRSRRNHRSHRSHRSYRTHRSQRSHRSHRSFEGIEATEGIEWLGQWQGRCLCYDMIVSCWNAMCWSFENGISFTVSSTSVLQAIVLVILFIALS